MLAERKCFKMLDLYTTVRVTTGRSQFQHLTPEGNVYLENYTSQYTHTAHILNGITQWRGSNISFHPARTRAHTNCFRLLKC